MTHANVLRDQATRYAEAIDRIVAWIAQNPALDHPKRKSKLQAWAALEDAIRRLEERHTRARFAKALLFSARAPDSAALDPDLYPLRVNCSTRADGAVVEIWKPSAEEAPVRVVHWPSGAGTRASKNPGHQRDRHHDVHVAAPPSPAAAIRAAARERADALGLDFNGEHLIRRIALRAHDLVEDGIVPASVPKLIAFIAAYPSGKPHGG